MRFLLDANIVTYCALFEGFLTGDSELEEEVSGWELLQGSSPDSKVLTEVHALRLLYQLDNRAHFDWLVSDIALEEIARIRSTRRRAHHGDLIDRLVEHRAAVLDERDPLPTRARLDDEVTRRFPTLPDQMRMDALQFVEAIHLEADYFLTNDERFIARLGGPVAGVEAVQPSKLPFVTQYAFDC